MGYFRQLFLEYLYLKILLLTIAYLGRKYNLNILHFDVRKENSSNESDGLIGYWVDDIKPETVPNLTANGKPLIILCAAELESLRIRAREYAALKKIQKTSPELQTDGVARREVRYRITQAEQLLYESLQESFELANDKNDCWIEGKQIKIKNITEFNSQLSAVCDRIYHKSPKIWNELINRRQLTSQGAKARLELAGKISKPILTR